MTKNLLNAEEYKSLFSLLKKAGIHQKVIIDPISETIEFQDKPSGLKAALASYGSLSSEQVKKLRESVEEGRAD
ncbi:hypothetical protein [Paenibacillus jiagnxiensis]|uniref:hypothetical protein n=1 Tax=Paenibacillus jiagnxiensis TaxID=3228926 RepID=UPI00339F51E4